MDRGEAILEAGSILLAAHEALSVGAEMAPDPTVHIIYEMKSGERFELSLRAAPPLNSGTTH